MATNALSPLEVLYDPEQGPALPLPPELSRLYGRIGFPERPGRPYVISNFVTTLDGVVSLGLADRTDGDEISGFNQHDSMVMALLRAVCDAVIVGAGSLRKSSQHIWTPEHVHATLTAEYKLLREKLHKQEEPLNVFVTASGNIDLTLPVFSSGKVKVVIITTAHGAQRLQQGEAAPWIQVVAASAAPYLTAREMLAALGALLPGSTTLMVEGGPHLIGYFFAEGLMDELFLTLAPQVAGRDGRLERLGLTAGKIFAPDNGVWGRLASLRRGGAHLFLRYAFETTSAGR